MSAYSALRPMLQLRVSGNTGKVQYVSLSAELKVDGPSLHSLLKIKLDDYFQHKFRQPLLLLLQSWQSILLASIQRVVAWVVRKLLTTATSVPRLQPMATSVLTALLMLAVLFGFEQTATRSIAVIVRFAIWTVNASSWKPRKAKTAQPLQIEQRSAATLMTIPSEIRSTVLFWLFTNGSFDGCMNIAHESKNDRLALHRQFEDDYFDPAVNQVYPAMSMLLVCKQLYEEGLRALAMVTPTFKYTRLMREFLLSQNSAQQLPSLSRRLHKYTSICFRGNVRFADYPESELEEEENTVGFPGLRTGYDEDFLSRRPDDDISAIVDDIGLLRSLLPNLRHIRVIVDFSDYRKLLMDPPGEPDASVGLGALIDRRESGQRLETITFKLGKDKWYHYLEPEEKLVFFHPDTQAILHKWEDHWRAILTERR